jgi:hypothetical protein
MGAKAGFMPRFCHHDTRGPPSIFLAQKTGTIADFPIRYRGGAYARIFCNSNEAELLSIDGYYRTAEQIDASLRSRPTQCWLEDRIISIAALN